MNSAKKIKRKPRRSIVSYGNGVLREDAPPYVVQKNGNGNSNGSHEYLAPNKVYLGDNRMLMRNIKPASVALSFWSPPYFVGKEYEKDVTFHDWQEMLLKVIECHAKVLIPGGFMSVYVPSQT